MEKHKEKNEKVRDNRLAHNLKELRSRTGFTQQQMADALSIDRSTYSYYETGRTRPDVYTLVDLAKLFHVSCDDLMDYTPNPVAMTGMGVMHNKNLDYKRLLSGTAISDLDRDEQKLTMIFRLLTPEQQAQLIELAIQIRDKNNEIETL